MILRNEATQTAAIDKITLFGIDIKTIVLLMLILCIILTIALVATTKKVNTMNKKYHALMSGKKGADLEKIIRIRFKEMDKIKANAKRVTREHKEMKKNVSHCLSRYGLVKYNAFDDVSGKMSFVLALLDEEGNGVVLNAMHSRESCYTYAKELIKGESFIPLSDEEKQAIQQAKTIDDEIEAMKAQMAADDYLNYVDEPSSYDEAAYTDEQYNAEGLFEGQTNQRQYDQQIMYAEQGQYDEQMMYAEQGQYDEQMMYAEQGQYDPQMMYAEQGQYDEQYLYDEDTYNNLHPGINPNLHRRQ